MTFLIGETCLGWVGVFIYLPFLTWLALKLLPASRAVGAAHVGRQMGRLQRN